MGGAGSAPTANLKGSIVNKTSLVAAAVLGAASFAATAGELYTPAQYEAPAASTLTRAQVHQSVLAERAAGGLQHNDVDLPAPVTPAFGKTRGQMRAEVLAARADGELNHTDVDLPPVATGSVLSRQQVRAEAIAARSQSRTAPGRNTIDY